MIDKLTYDYHLYGNLTKLSCYTPDILYSRITLVLLVMIFLLTP